MCDPLSFVTTRVISLFYTLRRHDAALFLICDNVEDFVSAANF